jgi:hypothetical protein
MAIALAGCGTSGEPPLERPPVAPPAGIPVEGLRRLTAAEYDAAVVQLTGVTSVSGRGVLPEDFLTPFDNDWTGQEPSRVLVEAVEDLASRVAAEVVAPGDLRDTLVGPTPAPAGREAALTAFTTDFGRLALRRPLADDERDDLVALGMGFVADGDYWDGVEVVIRALLQDPEFVYRVEDGEEIPGLPGYRRLDDYEIATRAGFALWGTPPDDWLLDEADAGNLVDPARREAVARTMLDDDRARMQADRFHALWLGYDEVDIGIFAPLPTLAEDLRSESRHLVQRVLFEDDLPWTDLFTFGESWVTPDVARHYGIRGVSAPTWTDVTVVDRAGLLSHGAFLSVAGNVLDTSPTKRGKLIRERLLCIDIPPPPPDVGADSPPPVIDGECKVDQYAAHRADPACAACHDQMDPIGFGLERYDLAGKFRAFEYTARTNEPIPECPIAGEGEVVGLGTFSGPAELGEMLVGSGALEPCMVDHLYQYTVGRPVEAEDQSAVDALTEDFLANRASFRELQIAIVADPRFGWRKLPEVP